MAEKTDAGEADSTTKDVSVGGVWSAGVAALLSVYPLVFCCVHQFLYPCLEVLIQYTSPPRAISQLQGHTRMLCAVMYLMRRPRIVVVGGQWFSSSIPALHRGCLLGCGHRSCGRLDSVSAVCAG